MCFTFTNLETPLVDRRKVHELARLEALVRLERNDGEEDLVGILHARTEDL